MQSFNKQSIIVLLTLSLSACAHHQGYDNGYYDSNYSNSDQQQQNRRPRDDNSQNQNTDNNDRRGRVRSE